MAVRVLVADDERLFVGLLRREFATRGIDIQEANDGTQALEALQTGKFRVAILDVRMPGMDGLAVLRELKGIQTAILILTGYADVAMAVEALKLGAREFFEKPIAICKIVSRASKLLLESHPSTHQLARRMDALLRKSRADPTLTLTELCKRLGISRSYAAKLFRENLGTTFRRQLSHYRVQMAKKRLAHTSDPIYLIADECGFKNNRRLSEAFRRIAGVSPSAYRHGFRGSE